MLKIDTWGRTMGIQFYRILEAYAACLYAHHPASIVFTDDLQPGTLADYRAVILVGQTVEMEPELVAALHKARAAGTAIYYDGTCRDSLMKGFMPLGVSFDQFEKDPRPASDDDAYWRFQDYNAVNSSAIKRALDPLIAPTARVASNQVALTERKAEKARYLFVVNNTRVPLGPGELWRMNLAVATLAPVDIKVGLPADASAVYDVLAMKRVTPVDGAVQADLRNCPARIYAILPAAISRVTLGAPATVPAGQSFRWFAEVQDDRGKPIQASIPFRLQLKASDGSILEDRSLAAGSEGVAGSLTLPVNLPAGPVTLEVVEMLSGKASRISIRPGAAALPLPFTDDGTAVAPLPRPAAQTYARGTAVSGAALPAEDWFGPHVRDMVLAESGSVAVLNTMNWDDNLYGVDVNTGQVLWRNRIGQYFAFAPITADHGAAVQGFDFHSAEGYNLYLLGDNGIPEKRFSLYGLSRRLPFRFVPGILLDRIDHFAMPRDGSWVASSGDLGLAVWSRDGKVLWQQDWWKTNRGHARLDVDSWDKNRVHSPLLAPLGNDGLVVIDDRQAAAYNAADGKLLWQVPLGVTGQAEYVAVGADTVAVGETTEGGRLFIIREGKLARTEFTPVSDVTVSADGTRVAVVTGVELKVFSATSGLEWTLPGDDNLRSPRFSVDGSRVAVCSELGTLYVVGVAAPSQPGRILVRRDMGGLAIDAWLPGGDLLAGAWEGKVVRLSGTDFKPVWTTLLKPAAGSAENLAMSPEVPGVRMTGWGNAEAQAAPLAPNLLADPRAKIQWVARYNWYQFAQPTNTLVDGKPDPPAQPWLPWTDVSQITEMSPFNYILLDAGRPVTADAITFVEDPAHPESWLRDAYIEYWDDAKAQWIFMQPLLSDQPEHTHRFAHPFTAQKFRVVPPFGVVGNLRFGEIVLHGT